MRKGCSGCGIGIVISRNVDGLNRSDRTFCGGVNSFLKFAVFSSTIVNGFLNYCGFTFSRNSKWTYFSTLQICLDEIDVLDPGLEHFKICILVNKLRSWLVNGVTPLCFDRPELVDGYANH